MKKIVLVTSTFNTGRGGVASYAHDFIEALNSNYNILVISKDKYHGDQEGFEFESFDIWDFSLTNAKKFIKLVESKKPDIIVNSNAPLMSLITPFLSNDIKVVSVSHYIDNILTWIAGLNGQYVDNIITLSTFGKKYICKKFKIPLNNVEVIYNSMPKLTDSVNEEKVNRPILKIAYPGGCSFHKSAEIVANSILRLLKTSLPFEIYWLGDTKVAGANFFQSKIKSLDDVIPDDPRIIQLGKVDRDKAKTILSEVNIFLLPSRGEGCPISLIEAMRSGCIPVISDTKHGSFDLIQGGKSGIIVRQGNPKELFETVEDIILNHSNYLPIYKNSFDRFNNTLNQSLWAEKMLSLLELNNVRRIRRRFDKRMFFISRLRLQFFIFRYHFIDRCSQLYHFIYFRYLKYFKQYFIKA